MRHLLRNATVIDGTGAPPVIADVTYEIDRVVDVGIGLDGDEEIDLTGRWLLPGFIDSHVHVMVDSFRLSEIMEIPFSLQFYVAAANLERTLRAGVTTARDMGGADLGVKEAVERGMVRGPQLQLTINLLSPTGGHADHWAPCGYAAPDLIPHPGRPDGVCDGTEVIAAARRIIRAGADALKVCASGGLLSPGDDPLDPGFTSAELETLVGIASSFGKPVAAHAHGGPGLRNAVRAGVRSVEHGTCLSDEDISLMLEHDVTYVPTLSALEFLAEGAAYSSRLTEQAQELREHQRRSVASAIAAGVRIAMGTDAGVGPHGQNLREIALLRECGMPPLDAITAGTLNSATALGVQADRGTIMPGKRADMVALFGDPTRVGVDLASDGLADVWVGGVRLGRDWLAPTAIGLRHASDGYSTAVGPKRREQRVITPPSFT